MDDAIEGVNVDPVSSRYSKTRARSKNEGSWDFTGSYSIGIFLLLDEALVSLFALRLLVFPNLTTLFSDALLAGEPGPYAVVISFKTVRMLRSRSKCESRPR